MAMASCDIVGCDVRDMEPRMTMCIRIREVITLNERSMTEKVKMLPISSKQRSFVCSGDPCG